MKDSNWLMFFYLRISSCVSLLLSLLLSLSFCLHPLCLSPRFVFVSFSQTRVSQEAAFFLVSYVDPCFLVLHRNKTEQFPLCVSMTFGCMCVLLVVCECDDTFICLPSFSITSIAFTLAVSAVGLQSLVGKCVCLCWTMSWTLTGHLTSTLGSDWTCHPA